jgi:hypothetical protein
LGAEAALKMPRLSPCVRGVLAAADAATGVAAGGINIGDTAMGSASIVEAAVERRWLGWWLLWTVAVA